MLLEYSKSFYEIISVPPWDILGKDTGSLTLLSTVVLLVFFFLQIKYLIGDPQHYEYLNQSGVYTISGVDDAVEFEDVTRAMTVLEMSDEVTLRGC